MAQLVITKDNAIDFVQYLTNTISRRDLHITIDDDTIEQWIIDADKLPPSLLKKFNASFDLSPSQIHHV